MKIPCIAYLQIFDEQYFMSRITLSIIGLLCKFLITIYFFTAQIGYTNIISFYGLHFKTAGRPELFISYPPTVLSFCRSIFFFDFSLFHLFFCSLIILY